MRLPLTRLVSISCLCFLAAQQSPSRKGFNVVAPSGVLFADSAAAPSRQAANAGFVKGPWLQNVKPDGIVVMWEAARQEVLLPYVEYGLTTDYEAGFSAATYQSVNGYHVYSASVSQISPDTIYHYRVTSGGSQSGDSTFKTSPLRGTGGFRFYVLGDSRSFPHVWGWVADRVWHDLSEYPEHHQSFVLNTGDLVYDGTKYLDWDQFWPPASELAARVPIYVSFGNHEDRNAAASDAFLYGYFDLPFLVSGSTDEKWYSFEYGNIHVSALALYDNGGFTAGPQYDWIQSDLNLAHSDALIDWIFVGMHFAPWSLGPHLESEALDQRTFLHPIFRDRSVDAAFGGHNHLYCRYLPVDGVPYITSGGGGAELHTGEYLPWSGAVLAAEAKVYHYCVVDVEQDAVSMRVLDIDGNLLDSVTFGKDPLNLPPFADAGPDREAAVGLQVLLDGQASRDPEAVALGYQWTQVRGTSVALSGGDSAQMTFTPIRGGRYLFRLRVFDGTSWSAPDFCGVTVAAGSIAVTPRADTYVNNHASDLNYGTESVLLVDGEPDTYHAYLQFNVTGVVGEVLRAKLRLYCIDPGDQVEIRTSSATDWFETAPTWNNPLPVDGPIVGRIKPDAVPAWIEADVTMAIRGNGPVTFVCTSSGTNGADFHSRENTNEPELLVSYSGVVEAQLKITMSKASYVNGDDVVATEFSLQNLATAAAACELKVWLGIPGIAPIGVLNLGADGSFVVPAGFEHDFGPLPLFTLDPGLPRGTYEFSSRIVDPVTGEMLSKNLNPFDVQ